MLIKTLRAFLVVQFAAFAMFSFVVYRMRMSEDESWKNQRVVSPILIRRASLRATKQPITSAFTTNYSFSTAKINHFNLAKELWTSVGFMGQLGNQMFQLASAYGIAKARGSKMCTMGFAGTQLDESVQLTQSIEECTNYNYRTVYEAGFGTYDPALVSQRGNITLYQYLQSYKYFDVVPFQLKPMAWAERWVEQHGVSVGIHVRRGDYAAQRQNGGRPPPALYFEYCLHLLRQRHGPLRAVVVSDDPDWVQAQPVFAAAILHRGTPAEDMALLAACSHVIASIGTFGWWAMRLKARPGECFYYADPWDYAVVPERRDAFRAADHFLPGWTGVGDAELAGFSPSVTVSVLGGGTPRPAEAGR